SLAPGFCDPEHPNKVWKLNKALYKLKQNPGIWYLRLHDHLVSQGFKRSGYESCLYIRRDDSGGAGGDLMVAVYVDDLVISGSSSAAVSAFKHSLASKCMISLIWGSSARFWVHTKVTRDRSRKCFYLQQTSFIKEAISKFGLDYLPACGTPMDHTIDLTPTPGFKCDLPTANRYRSMTGTLDWVANWTRPELAFSVHKLHRAQSNPEPKHFEAAKRAFRYLKGTQSECLRLGGGLVLRAFTDADFCSDRTDGKSVSGYVLLLGDAPIIWASRLQGAVTTSTVEAGYLALSSAVKDIMWLRHLLKDLSCPQHDPTPVVEDNSACIEWANDLVVSKKNRHFHVSYHLANRLAKEQVNNGNYNQMFYIKTHDQVADILTKALSAENFEGH
ncbi:unnamed protein product, partial [Heterosigma akashiwo]